MSGLIDIHSHIYPRWYIDLLKQRSQLPLVTGDRGNERFVIFPSEDHPGGGRPMDDTYWSLERKLEFMNRHGIERTLLSLGNPWLDPFGATEGLQLAREANAYFSRLETDTGGRVLGLGVLPPQDPRHAADVVWEIAGTSGLYGVVTGTRPCGVAIDDARLNPMWEALARTGLPTLIHPHYGAAMDEFAGLGHSGPVAMAFPFETTIAVGRLVLSGVLARYPAVRLIGSHGGGTLPFLAGRLDAGWKSDPSAQARLHHPPSEDLSRLYLDAIVYHARSLQAAADLVGTGHISFGTDHPFSVADPVANIIAIDEAFGGDSATDIRSRAATVLFGLRELRRD